MLISEFLRQRRENAKASRADCNALAFGFGAALMLIAIVSIIL